MITKWSHLKSEAMSLRMKGKSLPFIHIKLGIPKSTLSYWFKDIILTEKQKDKLHNDWKNALTKCSQESSNLAY